MIGPVSAGFPIPETSRLQNRERDQQVETPAEDREESADRGEAALDEARGVRSVIVEKAEAVLEDLRTAARASDTHLRIEQDDETGDFIYKSIDRESGEVIKEWPAEDVRRSMAFLNKLEGVVLDQSA